MSRETAIESIVFALREKREGDVHALSQAASRVGASFDVPDREPDFRAMAEKRLDDAIADMAVGAVLDRIAGVRP